MNFTFRYLNTWYFWINLLEIFNWGSLHVSRGLYIWIPFVNSWVPQLKISKFTKVIKKSNSDIIYWFLISNHPKSGNKSWPGRFDFFLSMVVVNVLKECSNAKWNDVQMLFNFVDSVCYIATHVTEVINFLNSRSH